MIFVPIAVKTTKHGRGIFTLAEVAKGAEVLNFEGKTVTWAEAVEHGKEDHVLPIGSNNYLDLAEPESLINHSCEANTGFSSDTTLVALKNIVKGEELTFDYSTITTDGWKMDCACGKKTCRRKIGDFKDLPLALQRKYAKHTPKWVLEMSGFSI